MSFSNSNRSSASPSAQTAPMPILRRNSSSRSSRGTTHQPASPRPSAMDSDLNSPNSMMPQRLPQQQQQHHRRNSSTDTKGARDESEAALRSWEAEEERLTNQLTRKLERLRLDRAKLEQDLEFESEAMVLRLQRQLAMLQQQQQQGAAPDTPASPDPSSSTATAPDPAVATLKQENASLRERLAQAEREFNKQLAVAANYRREVHQLRTRLGMDTADLTTSPTTSTCHSHSSSSSIHDVLASPDFTCEPAGSSGRVSRNTTPSEHSYSTPLVPINTPAASYAAPSNFSNMPMSPPPAPAPSLSSSVQDAHAYHPHASGYRRVAEEGHLQPRSRRSASIASATLNDVAEDSTGSEWAGPGQHQQQRNRADEELVAGEMD